MSIPNPKLKLSVEKKFKYVYKSLFASLIGIIVLIADFVHDIYYYGSAVIMFILVIVLIAVGITIRLVH